MKLNQCLNTAHTISKNVLFKNSFLDKVQGLYFTSHKNKRSVQKRSQLALYLSHTHSCEPCCRRNIFNLAPKDHARGPKMYYSGDRRRDTHPRRFEMRWRRLKYWMCIPWIKELTSTFNKVSRADFFLSLKGRETTIWPLIQCPRSWTLRSLESNCELLVLHKHKMTARISHRKSPCWKSLLVPFSDWEENTTAAALPSSPSE